MDKIIKYNILIKDGKSYGISDIAYTNNPYERYIPETYVDKFENTMIDNQDNKIENIKLYGVDCKKPIDALNEILRYWFVNIKRIEEMPKILDFENLKGAIKYLNDNENKYIIFKLKEK